MIGFRSKNLLGAERRQYYNYNMEIHGHIQNGAAVPDELVNLPEGANVTIVMSKCDLAADVMSADEAERYRRALAELDAVANENPGDEFSGAKHDQALYGSGK